MQETRFSLLVHSKPIPSVPFRIAGAAYASERTNAFGSAKDKIKVKTRVASIHADRARTPRMHAIPPVAAALYRTQPQHRALAFCLTLLRAHTDESCMYRRGLDPFSDTFL